MKMVILKITLLLCFIFSYIHSQGINPIGIPRTPKAMDLENHFGTEPVDGLYGPAAHGVVIKGDIAREYDTVDGVKATTPISNLDVIKPENVSNGQLNNTAYDASRIISPELAAAKAKINATFVTDAVVNTPVQIGTHIETKEIKVYDRRTGEITGKEKTTEKPVISVLKNLRKVSTEKTSYVNLEDGKIIDTQLKTGFVGI